MSFVWTICYGSWILNESEWCSGKKQKKQFSVSFQNIENASDPDSTIALHKIRIPDKNIFALGHPDCTSPEDLKQIINSYNIANYWTKVSKGTIYRLNFSAREIHRLYNHISVYGKVLYENTRGQFMRCETANTCTRHCLYHPCTTRTKHLKKDYTSVQHECDRCRWHTTCKLRGMPNFYHHLSLLF